jgi:hypothetical protein
MKSLDLDAEIAQSITTWTTASTSENMINTRSMACPGQLGGNAQPKAGHLVNIMDRLIEHEKQPCVQYWARVRVRVSTQIYAPIPVAAVRPSNPTQKCTTTTIRKLKLQKSVHLIMFRLDQTKFRFQDQTGFRFLVGSTLADKTLGTLTRTQSGSQMKRC